MNKENPVMTFTAVVCLALIVLITGSIIYSIYGKETPKDPREISVVLYSAGTGGWESLSEGLKRAGEDFSININYVTLREGADADEQLATIKREIENGAEGIIVAVSDYSALYELWLQEDYTIPVVAVESGFNETTIPMISADNYGMGKMLGEEILKDFPDNDNLTVALAVPDTIRRDSLELREKGLRDTLDGKARIISMEDAANGEGVEAAAALDKEMFLQLSTVEMQGMDDIKYYGIGNTTATVAALDQGKIEKIIFQNEFNMGYLAVDTLLRQMEGASTGENQSIDYYCVAREQIYDPPFEQLLFPIVE